MTVAPKKHLGQHFLTDENVARDIVAQINTGGNYTKLLEIGPGMGAITKYLINLPHTELHVMEVDKESVIYLEKNFPSLSGRIHQQDFLKTDLKNIFGNEDFVVAGNFPYNISSQILLKCIDSKDQVGEITGMFQKELADRIMAPPGTKNYGIVNVLLQTYYDIEYCFTVEPHVFNPPPKVRSAVIRCTRNARKRLGVDEGLHQRIVKTTFNQRRKTIRNTLKGIVETEKLKDSPFLSLRPEQLSVEDFIVLTGLVEKEN
ncbi:MAG: 16S rRNA (adenine(1518)-N(6)/adenine(1519)-N(6))-dimethyltransferase RsmA [Brumimicrobium sp.]|nr:16S rRNA (adenine(1518)-N(6)/adenine(1519)-N(6))-dimethyltransferase RsmA [Brumimicrobium sp.]